MKWHRKASAAFIPVGLLSHTLFTPEAKVSFINVKVNSSEILLY